MNASGVFCTEDTELNELLNTNVGVAVTKSTTLERREGNPHPRYYTIPNGSINSMGLPNNGINYYLDYIENKKSEKPIFLSVAGLSFEENIKLIELANECDNLSLIELNLSCPNITGKPQVGYDFETSEQLLRKVFKVSKKPIGVKLPPYFDMSHFQMMANVLNKYPLRYVCCVNSIGNGLWVNDESTSIKPKNGFGGIGGDYIKPTALANVRMFYKLLNDIDVVGCGGVKTGRDVFEHILCGASMVQIGTTLWEEGVECFNRIEQELVDIMNVKGYSSIEEFKGKLKEI
jgi:dihydroorotate dehydrogenase (fumarate)